MDRSAQQTQYKGKAADRDPDRGKQNRRRQSHPGCKRLTDRDDDKQTGNDGENNGSVEHDYTNGWVGIGLNLDLSAEFDHPVRGDTEELRRGKRIAMHRLEQPTPDRA